MSVNAFDSAQFAQFVEALQTQYDNWIKEKAKAPHAGIQENPVVTNIKNDEPEVIQKNPVVTEVKNAAPEVIQKNPVVEVIQENPVVTDVKNAAPADFTDNPNLAAVKTAVDKCFDILYENRSKLDSSTVDCSKDVMKAFAMPHSEVELDEFDVEPLGHYLEGKTMPPNLAKYLGRLGQIAELAAVRNELTTVETGWSSRRSSRTTCRTRPPAS